MPLRPAQQEGHVRRCLIPVRLAPQVMIAQHVAVIGEEYDQRFLQPAAPFQRFQHPPDLLVHERDRAVVALPRPPHLCLAEIAVPRVAPGTARFGEPARPPRHHRLGQIGACWYRSRAAPADRRGCAGARTIPSGRRAPAAGSLRATPPQSRRSTPWDAGARAARRVWRRNRSIPARSRRDRVAAPPTRTSSGSRCGSPPLSIRPDSSSSACW